MDEQTNPPTNGDDVNQLRELALALILPRHGMMETAEDKAPELLVGQRPPDFGDDFPIPPGARILGSLVAAQPILVLDTDQAGEDVILFYQQQLAPSGWNIEAFPGPMHGGFLHSGMLGRQFANFHRDDGVALQVMANAGPGGRTIVQLTRLPDDSGRQRAQRHAHRMGRDPWQVLPPIAPPPHSEQYQEGGSSGEDRVVTSARIESDADLATLAAHYTTQLEKAGWQREDGGVSEPVAWSAWTFTDEEKQPWRALFVLLKWPGEPRRSWAQLVAEWVGERGGDGVHIRTSLIGWQTHTTTGTIGGS